MASLRVRSSRHPTCGTHPTTVALMSIRLPRFSAIPLVALGIFGQVACAVAADPINKLPQEHDYQKTLYNYLGTLTEKDFDHGVSQKPTVTPPADADELYRTWLLTLEFPRVGRKRSAPAINLPPAQFLRATIEDPQQGVLRPAVWPEPAAWVANWNYAGNPYNGSRAMKLRAFVTMTVMMLMTDAAQDHPTML